MKDPSHKLTPPSAADAEEAALLARRLGFLQLADADARAIRQLGSLFANYMSEFAELFYKHLTSFEETSRFLGEPGRLARLKQLQQEHFESLLEARWNDDYVEQRRRVGQMHADVGIEPHLFLGAYNQYVQICFRHFSRQHGRDLEHELPWLLPLLKAIFLDVGLTLDAYFLQATRNQRVALDMLLRANTELRQFAQLTSHDLKTPLATVANLCDEAVDEFGDQMPAEAQELVRKASQGVFRMSTLIDELLATVGKVDTEHHAKIRGEELIHAAAEPLRALLAEKAIDLQVHGPLPAVWGDRVRLREAFYNLLANAAKFIDRRPGIIEVRAQVDGALCQFSIADNGPGIPASELERIFVPFRRLPMHRGHPGSGLGLYFTKNMVEAQGGRVWAESEPGRGSRFIVELRRSPDEVEPPRGAAP